MRDTLPPAAHCPSPLQETVISPQSQASAPGGTQIARARDGARVAYSLYGDTASPRRIALIHSLAMDRRFWTPVAERLAGNAAVLVYDCRGHGASEKPPGPYTVEGFAQDLADLLDQLRWPRAVVAGASMGGCVTLAFAAAHPGRAAGVGLIDTTAWYGPTAPADWAERAKKAAEGGMRALVQFQTTRWFADDFRERNPAIVQQCIEIFCANDLAAYVETCRMLGAADLRAALPAFRMPAAVVVGEEDYATPVTMAKAIHEGIAGSTLEVLPNARHLTPLEQPDAIARVLSDLLDRTEV